MIITVVYSCRGTIHQASHKVLRFFIFFKKRKEKKNKGTTPLVELAITGHEK